MEAVMAAGASCAPNLSPGARHLRVRVSRAAGVAVLVALVASVALALPWWVRAIAVYVPAAVAIISYLEARSSVCVVGAVAGTFENDDRSKVAMDDHVLPAIRRVATSISLKSVLLALPLAIVAALTALVR